MTDSVSSPFTFDSWDEEGVVDEAGAQVVSTRFFKRFTGDLEATSIGQPGHRFPAQGGTWRIRTDTGEWQFEFRRAVVDPEGHARTRLYPNPSVDKTTFHDAA